MRDGAASAFLVTSVPDAQSVRGVGTRLDMI